ncbi:uncharacterized protein LOC130903200 [Diorhabda carinulata]|uniref:uncharacterized protein LOC130903200 n=1 Tax=Diorhabda carinulata TaxID=1163345 RepID=UPI0025A09965|nr:uncharacterized protein LOC130903200 [Diorhabda carinulata]
MKMADNTIVAIKNNCEFINSKCVEVKINENTKASCLADQKTITTKFLDGIFNSSDISTQEEAVEEYLAGNEKTDFNEEFLPCADNSEEGISFKSENVLEINNEYETTEEDVIRSKKDIAKDQTKRTVGSSYVVRSLKKRSIKWKSYQFKNQSKQFHGFLHICS